MDRATAELWMREALEEARKAEAEGEIPVGALVLIHGKIVGRGHNRPITVNDPTAHAEIMALRHAARTVQNYRLLGAVLVVTLEPCVMCAGAMVQARIDQLVYGAADPKAGAIHSHLELADASFLNHRIEVISGILNEECGSLVRSFFESRR